MADLRIVDAPEIPTENITGEEKLPTGGSGNYSITLDSVADYTKTKKDLADNISVNSKVNGVRQELDAHIEDLLNPHQVTKGQIGLGNVDNTADADKPVSNSTQAAIISGVAPKADKTYVDSQLLLKSDKTYVDSTLLTKADKTYTDSQLALKADKTYVDTQDSSLQLQINQKAETEYVNTALTNLSTAANKFYPTLAQANADIANIAVNQPVNIGEVVNGGLWYKATSGSTSLTKSPYDPLTQAKNYTDSLVDDVPIKNKSDLDDLAVSVAFSDNSRTWLEANKSGRPSEHSKSILKDELNIDDRKDYADYSVAFAYKDDSVLFGFDKKANPMFYGKNPYNAYGFVAYGDSTTEGADLVNPLTERWTTLLSTQIGKVIENRGISGARAEEIQARFGAINANMSVASNTMPASGTVILTSIDVNPVRLGGALSVELLCEDFTKVKGTLSYASATTAVFTRATTGTAVTSKRVKVISTSQANNRKKIMFLGQGINNQGLVSSGVQTIDQIKSWYKSGVTHLSAANPEYIIWGVLDRGVSEAVGTPNGDFIKDLESWLLVEFGSRYAPVRQFLSSQYAIDVAKIFNPSFTPTTADTDAIAVGRTPVSFRYNAGSVHLNALGHQLQAWFFKQHLISRGII